MLLSIIALTLASTLASTLAFTLSKISRLKGEAREREEEISSLEEKVAKLSLSLSDSTPLYRRETVKCEGFMVAMGFTYRERRFMIPLTEDERFLSLTPEKRERLREILKK